MPDLETFSLINATLRCCLTILLAFKLYHYYDSFNSVERAGIGVMAGTTFLTIAPVLDIRHVGTPFDGWAGTVFTIGALCYFAGRMSRHWHRGAAVL
jgi:hypothetical protein